MSRRGRLSAPHPARALHARVVGHALLRTLGDYDPARFRELAMRFSAPVYPGETVRVEIWRDGSFRALVPSATWW